MLCDKLKAVICSKKWGQLSQGGESLRDHARRYIATHIVQTLQKLYSEVLKH
jgi:hypothetical protein